MSGPEPVAVDPSDRLAWAPDVLARRTPRSVLLCTEAVPEPLALRDSAVMVWDEFEDGATTATVVSALAARFGAHDDGAAADIASLIAELCRAGALSEIP